jgi:hypothetical protein
MQKYSPQMIAQPRFYGVKGIPKHFSGIHRR